MELSAQTPPWYRDPWARAAVLVGALLRALALAAWPSEGCARDECIYVLLARSPGWEAGVPPTPQGWLWAPLYPSLLALHERLLGDVYHIRITQVLLSIGIIALGYALARRVGGRRAGRVAAWALALSPTLIFFARSMWTETLYVLLLLGTFVGIGAARGDGPNHSDKPFRAALPGVTLGLMVLLRGVATWAAPIFFISLVWGRWRSRAAWTGALVMLVFAGGVVAPYSLHASARWDGRVISDRTLGEVLWISNNNFPPLTFDHGVGPATEKELRAWVAEGRPRCTFDGDPTRRDACEVAAGVDWITSHPVEFLRRVPLRLSQTLNPHSFLTRHLRQGGWPELPEPAREALVVAVATLSLVTVLGGSLGLIALGRGWLAAGSGLFLLYNLVVVGVLAGSSRFRVPLDALWMIYAAALLVSPRGALDALRASRWRALVAAAALLLLSLLSLRFLPVAWS